MKTIPTAIVVVGLLWCPVPEASAQTGATTDVTTMSIEELLEVRVVSVASRFPQEVREAPASITVVTAQDIRRYGHRTLADVLRSVRGFYTTYDRNYAYLGTRGFGRPGDYNTRVLLMLDGHRLNDPVYDMAPIGTDFPIDVSLIDKIEVIRGPASSLYGTNAVFAVINVVTRTGAQHSGLRVESAVGSLGTRGGTVSVGRAFKNGADLLLAGTAQRAGGADELYFPELEAAGSGNGRAVHLDGERSSNVFGSFSGNGISVRGGLSSRRKRVPTAAFGTVFGDDRLETSDTRAFLNAEYDAAIGKGWTATARAAFDYYAYGGVYPYDYGEPEPVLFTDGNDSRTITGDVAARRRIARRHLVTVGTEVRRQYRNHMFSGDQYGLQLDVRRPGTFVGIYAQDEVRIFRWLLTNVGLRLDRSPTFGTHVTPRAAVVFLPRPQTSVKVLHGRAFRAPNTYELGYYTAMRNGTYALERETVRTTEVVWEELVSTRVRAAFTAFT